MNNDQSTKMSLSVLREKPLLSTREVCKLVCLSRNTVYKMMQTGDFPKPIKITAKKNAWSQDQIHRFLIERANPKLRTARINRGESL